MSKSMIVMVMLCCAAVVSGCGRVFNAVKPDEVIGKFPTTVVVSRDEVKIYEPATNLKELSFFYVRSLTNTGFDRDKEYYPYVDEMLRNSGLTGKIIKTPEIEDYVIKKNISQSVSNLQSRIGLNQLSKHIGNFMLVETVLDDDGANRWTLSILVLDAAEGKVKFHIRRSITNWKAILFHRWYGLADDLLNPVFNEFKTWLDESYARSSENKPLKGQVL